MRVQSREPAALEEFFDRYFPRIYGLTQRMLGDPTAAQDVTQDIFFKIHRAADRIDPERDPGPWLTAIACNTCRKYWRSKAYRMERRSDSFEDTPGLDQRLPSDVPGPEEVVVAEESAERVQQAIATLPESLRESILLHAYQGIGHEQIAEMMGVSHAAARKRYSRALAELGKALKDLGV